MCRIPAPTGSLTLDGNVTLSAPTGSCPNVLLEDVTQTVDLTLVYRDAEGITRRAVAADLMAVITEHRGLDNPCLFTGVTATVSGTIEMLVTGSHVDVELIDTQMVADVSTFDEECLPLVDVKTLNGQAGFTEQPQQRAHPVDFESFSISRTHTATGFDIEETGTALGPCFDGESTVATPSLISLPLGDQCPSAGTVTLFDGETPTRTVQYIDGTVEVDADADGDTDDTYPSCVLAPACG